MTPEQIATGARARHLLTTRQIADQLRALGRPAEALGLYHHLLKRVGNADGILDAYIRCAREANHDPAEGLAAVLQTHAGSRVVRSELIRLEWRRKNYQKVRDLVATAPGDPDVAWLIAAAGAALNQGDDAEALRLFKAGQQLEPGNEEAAAGLARLRARQRDFGGVLAALEEGVPSSAPAGLNSIGMRIAAHRRLGRTDDAARAASDGLGDLMASDNQHDMARLLARLGFEDTAERHRNGIRVRDGTDGRSARSRLAGQLLAEGRVSAGLAEYRKLGGRKWRSRISPANITLLDRTTRAFGSGLEDKDWHSLDRKQVALPDGAFRELTRRAIATRSEPWDIRQVLMVTGTLGAGGAERQLVLTTSGLAARTAAPGWPHLATLQDLSASGNAHLLPELADKGIVHHDLLAAHEGSPGTLPLRLAHCRDLVDLLPRTVRAQLCSLIRLVVHERPGVVHGWQDATGAVAALAALLCGVPRIIIGTRSIAPDRKEGRNRPWLRDLMRALLADARVRLLNNSRSGAADYSRWLAIPLHRIIHVPNGFDLPDLPDNHARAAVKDTVVGGVMRLTEEKRPDLWLDAVIWLIRNGRDVKGLLVGDGPMMDQLSARVADADLGERIELAGRRNDMPAQYGRMDMLMLTSRTEGLPNVLVEAQAFGKPVVSSDAGGAAETFVDGETGYLAQVATPEGLAEKAGLLLDDPDRCRAMGRAGAVHARTEFGLDKMLDRTAAAYGWPGGK